MHALKWWKLSTRMFFEGEGSGSGGDGGSGSASSASSAPPSGGDGGGGSTPAPDAGAPASSEPASPDSSSDDGGMDWAQLGSSDDLDVIEVPAAPPAAAAAPPKKYGAAAKAPAPAAPAPAPATPPAAAPAAPAAAAAAQPTPAPAEPQAPPAQLSPADPVGIANALQQNRDASIAHLAQTRFALSQEDIAELEDNAAAFVPKMMARVLHESQVSMMKFLAQSVPGMLQKFQTVTQANTDAENQFFAKHKDLGLDPNNAEHRKAAFRLAKLYRQSNPDMPMEQLIADIGPVVAMHLKLSPVPQAQGQVPGRPGGQPQLAPGVPRPTGFRPAVNGGGGASPAAEAPNEWAGLGQDFEQG